MRNHRSLLCFVSIIINAKLVLCQTEDAPKPEVNPPGCGSLDPNFVFTGRKINTCYYVLHPDEITFARKYVLKDASDGYVNRTFNRSHTLQVCKAINQLSKHNNTDKYRSLATITKYPDLEIRLPTPKTDDELAWIVANEIPKSRCQTSHLFSSTCWYDVTTEVFLGVDLRQDVKVTSPRYRPEITKDPPHLELGGNCAYFIYQDLKYEPTGDFGYQGGLHWVDCDRPYKPGYNFDYGRAMVVVCEIPKPQPCVYTETDRCRPTGLDTCKLYKETVIHQVNHPLAAANCPNKGKSELQQLRSDCPIDKVSECVADCVWAPWRELDPDCVPCEITGYMREIAQREFLGKKCNGTKAYKDDKCQPCDIATQCRMSVFRIITLSVFSFLADVTIS